MAGRRVRAVAPIALVAASFAFLYGGVARGLLRDWSTDANYSHGFLIVPIAAYLAWDRRSRLAALPAHPSAAGLAWVAASLALLAAGTLGAELFLTRVSMVGVVAGAIVYLYGWGHLRVLAFPVTFLLLMIPLPAIVFNQLTFPLQLIASRAGAAALTALGIPVLREGNIIVLAHTTLEVAEACSGIRSLVSLVTLATVYGYFVDSRPAIRALLVVSTVPVAIVANAARVAGTGIAAQWGGPAAAEGFFHTFSGWLVFAVAIVAMFAVRRLLVSSVVFGGLRPHVVHG